MKVFVKGVTELWQQQQQQQQKKYYKRKKRILEMFTIYYSLQGEECIMGMKRVFQNLKASVRCVKARDQYNFQMSESCPCTEADFEW